MASNWNWGVWIGAEEDTFDEHYRLIKFVPEEIASGVYHGLYSCHYGQTVRAPLMSDGSEDFFHAIKKFQILGCTNTSVRIQCRDAVQCSESLNGQIVAHAPDFLQTLRLINSEVSKNRDDCDGIRKSLDAVSQVLKHLPDFAFKEIGDINHSRNP